MRGLTPPDTTRNTAARPRLSLTVQLGLLGLLLLFALTLWLSRPLLGGIIDKSHQMRTQHLPELTRWRHNTQRVEQLYGFIETLYWTSDLQVARNSRLQAQVLVNSFAFPPDSPLAEQSGQLVDTIKRLAQLREQQRDLLGQLREQGHRLLAAPPYRGATYRAARPAPETGGHQHPNGRDWPRLGSTAAGGIAVQAATAGTAGI